MLRGARTFIPVCDIHSLLLTYQSAWEQTGVPSVTQRHQATFNQQLSATSYQSQTAYSSLKLTEMNQIYCNCQLFCRRKSPPLLGWVSLRVCVSADTSVTSLSMSCSYFCLSITSITGQESCSPVARSPATPTLFMTNYY